jgi:hypothetical protein
MNSENPEQDENTGAPEPKPEDSALNDFLQKRKLQIRVLQKMLEQIPVEPGENTPQEKSQKEEQS